MHFLKLAQELPLFFTTKDVQGITQSKEQSARALCARYTREGLFTRLRRDLYAFTKVFEHLGPKDRLELSNHLHEHSYLSFATALAHYGVAPHLPHVIEAVSFKRTSERRMGHTIWTAHKFPKAFFFAYQKIPLKTNKRTIELIIATPEKALLDTLYLYSLGRYEIDLRKINLERIDLGQLLELAEKFPPRTQKLLKNLYGRSKSR